MDTENKFKQSIKEIFHLKNGQTVFAGPVEEGPEYLQQTSCKLMVDGILRQELRLEEEMLTEGQHPENHRALLTTEKVNLTQEEVLSNFCLLEN